MIAEPNRHIHTETMRDLLEERLDHDLIEQVESHLGACPQCQSELESIAGQPDWWNETIDVLSESTLRPVEGQVTPLRSRTIDASLDWILPLFDKSSDGELGRIDQYPIEGVIGQGGMGVVLRGTDPALHRPVAIKILSPHLAGVGAARARFMREAQAAAAIVHPSIVPIYSIATASRLPYIVMPCIAGGNLQERINRDGPLELSEILRMGLQIAEGLVAAHQHGVIHRDIKPANILIEEGNGRVLISDFGLARALDDATLTMSGMIAGTPQFMSPEQASGEPIDERTDIFSLGSLLYALATGRPPFRAESPLAVLRKIAEVEPRPIHVINEQMPRWLDRLVRLLMTKQKEQRISTTMEAASLLRETLAHVRNPDSQPLPNTLAKRNQKRKKLGILATTVVTMGAMTGLAFIPEHRPRTPKAVDEKQEPMSAEVAPYHQTPQLDWHGNELVTELDDINQSINQQSESFQIWDVVVEGQPIISVPDTTSNNIDLSLPGDSIESTNNPTK